MELPRGILCDYQIEYLAIEHGMIDPFASGEKRPGVISYGLTSFGYDMRVADEWSIISTANHGVIDPKNTKIYESHNGASFTIEPGQFVLCRSVEYWKIPDDIVGIVLGKSTYARHGISCLCTPMEPGWEGHLTIELANTGQTPVMIYAWEGIAQVQFLRGDAPHINYRTKGGKYQGQRGVTVGKVE